MANTKLPWSAQNGIISDGEGYIPIHSPWGEDAWEDDENAEANASLICKAVNSHEGLLQDIEDLKHDIANALQTASQEADFATEAMKCRDTLIEALEKVRQDITLGGIQVNNTSISQVTFTAVLKALKSAKGEDEV